MKIHFDDFLWHDSVLEEISIDRSNPGKNDSVKIKVNWVDGNTSILGFNECFALKMNMNFGIIAQESILEARLILQSQELEIMRTKWLQMGVNLYDLKCYQITTSSTGSEIQIYALKCIVTELEVFA